MKIVIAICLLFSLASWSQPPKHSKTIKIIGVSFREVAQALVDSGFYFESIDSNFKTLRTEINPKKRYDIRYMVRVKDSVAYLTGHWTSSNTYFEIENINVIVYRQTWQDMNKFALAFGRPVEYLKN